MNSEPARAWRCAAASVRGLSHERAGLPCQDAYGRLYDGNTLVCVIADGAGSAELADVGARTACDAALAYMAEALQNAADMEAMAWEAALRGAASRARVAVEAEALDRSAEPRALASTLVLAAAYPGGAAALQIGDGACIVQDAGCALVAITRPQNGEYPNETRFLSSDNALEDAEFTIWCGDITGLALFSDGLQHIALAGSECVPHPPFFTPLLRFAAAIEDQEEADAALARFLKSPRFEQRTDDDLTLIVCAMA